MTKLTLGFVKISKIDKSKHCEEVKKMTLKEGMYYSKKENRTCYLYKQGHSIECQECGKVCKNPYCFVWQDDEDQLENIYGSECIKKLQLERK